MLIKCPECNKEVSEQANICIHCGFPLKDKSISKECIINGERYDLSDLLEQILSNADKVHTLIKLRQKCNLQLAEATKLYEVILQNREIPNEFNYNMEASQLISQPKCPTCQSTDVHKMSALETGASVAVLGLFSRKINKTFKCKHCGYMW